MNVLLSGFVPEEGRVSMLRTAAMLHRHLQPELRQGEKVVLLDDPVLDHPIPVTGGFRTKIKKRLLHPLKLNSNHHDVHHVIDSDYAFGIPASLRKRTLVTCHDLMPLLLDPTLKSVFAGRMGRYCYRKGLLVLQDCARIICDSEFTHRTLLDSTACNEQNVTTIPLGVDEHFRVLPAEHPGLSAFIQRHDLAGKRVLLHVGSCAPYKNIKVLLQAIAEINAGAEKPCILLKVGGQFTEEQKAIIARLQLENTLCHCPILSEAELVCAYNAADLLLWPSRFEGFGLPVLEAMACGTPVVCSDGGALPEVAGEAACIHDPDDQEGFVGSCLEILNNPNRAEALHEAGLKQAARFTWKSTATAYLEQYRAIAERIPQDQ